MKYKVKVIIVSFLLALFPLYAYSMTVSFFIGSATLTRGGKSVAIKVGDIVSGGDIVKTQKNGIVELTYDDSSKITIKGDTVVQIGNKNVKDSGDIAVVSGEVNGKFGKLKKGEHRIGSPTTVCGVRGTEFNIAVSKGGDTKVDLKQGRLDVRNPYGKVDLNEGFSAEIDLAAEPVSGETESSLEAWQGGKNSSLERSVETQADKYEKHINNFGEESEKSSKELQSIGEATKRAKTKEELALSGEKISGSEKIIADNMLMNEASKNSVDLLKEDYGSRNTAIKNRFNELAKKCNKVQEQQLKNYLALQKVKEDYNKAYEKIMKKYSDDKSKILKPLEEYKKTNPMKR